MFIDFWLSRFAAELITLLIGGAFCVFLVVIAVLIDRFKERK